MRPLAISAQALVLLVVLLTKAAFAKGSQQGKELFQQRCTGCHALDSDKVGPRLRRVFGKPAGSVSTYLYSDALKSAQVLWNETTLDKWISDPDSLIADSDMAFRLDNAEERAAIIQYLKHLDSK